MRELERHPHTPPAPWLALAPSVGVLGQGRLGRILAAGLQHGGVPVSAPLPRGAELDRYDVVLLCVPDAQIASAAAAVSEGRLVGHCSGATSLAVLAPHEAFSMHPLMTVTPHDDPSRLVGAAAAVAGSTERALKTAGLLAERLGMRPFALAEEDRAAYHAAASMASNFLVALEAAAERVAAGTGAGREQLVPLVRATVDNWASLGAEAALTGPVARGDTATVAAQREAILDRAPELVATFDALVQATRALAERGHGRVSTPSAVRA